MADGRETPSCSLGMKKEYNFLNTVSLYRFCKTNQTAEKESCYIALVMRHLLFLQRCAYHVTRETNDALIATNQGPQFMTQSTLFLSVSVMSQEVMFIFNLISLKTITLWACIVNSRFTNGVTFFRKIKVISSNFLSNFHKNFQNSTSYLDLLSR